MAASLDYYANLTRLVKLNHGQGNMKKSSDSYPLSLIPNPGHSVQIPHLLWCTYSMTCIYICSHWSCTNNRQWCAPKLCECFFVHAFTYVCLMDQLTQVTVACVVVTWHVVKGVHLCTPSPGVFIATTSSLVALCIVTMTVFGVVTAVLCSKIHKMKQKGNLTIM